MQSVEDEAAHDAAFFAEVARLCGGGSDNTKKAKDAKPRTKQDKPWFCYWLRSAQPGCGRTYVGITNDLVHRLRQHNGELVGGAAATHSNRPWRFFMVLGGFPTERAARQAEHRLHHVVSNGREKPPPEYRGVDGRVRALCMLVTTQRRFTTRQEVTTRDMPLRLYVDEARCSLLTPEAAAAFRGGVGTLDELRLG